jgi:hypothetical protein
MPIDTQYYDDYYGSYIVMPSSFHVLAGIFGLSFPHFLLLVRWMAWIIHAARHTTGLLTPQAFKTPRIDCSRSPRKTSRWG